MDMTKSSTFHVIDYSLRQLSRNPLAGYFLCGKKPAQCLLALCVISLTFEMESAVSPLTPYNTSTQNITHTLASTKIFYHRNALSCVVGMCLLLRGRHIP